MFKALHTSGGVCFSWAESRPWRSILTLVGQGEYSWCLCVKEREMACWHLLNSFNTWILPNVADCTSFVCMCSPERSLRECEQVQGLLEGQVSLIKEKSSVSIGTSYHARTHYHQISCQWFPTTMNLSAASDSRLIFLNKSHIMIFEYVALELWFGHSANSPKLTSVSSWNLVLKVKQWLIKHFIVVDAKSLLQDIL